VSNVTIKTIVTAVVLLLLLLLLLCSCRQLGPFFIYGDGVTNCGEDRTENDATARCNQEVNKLRETWANVRHCEECNSGSFASVADYRKSSHENSGLFGSSGRKCSYTANAYCCIDYYNNQPVQQTQGGGISGIPFNPNANGGDGTGGGNMMPPQQQQPQPTWNQPQQPQPSWNQPQPSWNQPQPSWNQPQPSWNQPQPSWNQPQPSWQQPQPAMDPCACSSYDPCHKNAWSRCGLARMGICTPVGGKACGRSYTTVDQKTAVCC
jgi:hypothetical protein